MKTITVVILKHGAMVFDYWTGEWREVWTVLASNGFDKICYYVEPTRPDLIWPTMHRAAIDMARYTRLWGAKEGE